MGTVMDKLNRLLQTKNAIREAITGKGQAIADTDPFSSYAAKIAAIQTGSDASLLSVVGNFRTSDSTMRIPVSGISESVLDSISNILVIPYSEIPNSWTEILSKDNISVPTVLNHSFYYPICVWANKPAGTTTTTSYATYFRVAAGGAISVVTGRRPHSSTMLPTVNFNREVADGMDGFTVTFRGNTTSAQVKMPDTSRLAVLTSEIDAITGG